MENLSKDTFQRFNLIKHLIKKYPYANINISEIQSIMSEGPNLKLLNGQNTSINNNNYLSLRWYFYGLKDEYNP